MYAVVQLALGVLVLWLLAGLAIPARARAAVVLMLLVVVIMLVGLTPAITSLGRRLDFVPRNPPPSGMGSFWMLHGAYTILEGVLLASGAAAAIWIARSRGSAKA